ncbi:DUF4389 domain-containing protein [Sphaerisporangium aureirubrum]|uniref:DUF4389 domain-containing protein n=1 Tax=Sphaerisporangium aureirubrum TaxID=1544736 RepID=A0ABW1N8I4_9ACTN
MSSTTPMSARAPTLDGEPSPIRVNARLEGPLSRWLWLVKWLLLVPHVLVLIPLWIAFVVLSFVALVAIVITGRYPRAIFDFNLGVMRWSWRVSYYGYEGLGTDRYPPFTLADVPGYPARLDIDYPPRLHRGLALVKWLLAVPHLVIVGILFGGGPWLSWQTDTDALVLGSGGLAGLLVLIAGITVLFTGEYPRPLFDLIMGLNRWGLRVAGYVALMTDQYPPFRLDSGGDDPAGPAVPRDLTPPNVEPVVTSGDRL